MINSREPTVDMSIVIPPQLETVIVVEVENIFPNNFKESWRVHSSWLVASGLRCPDCEATESLARILIQ